MSFSNATLAATAAEQAATRAVATIVDAIRNGDYAPSPWMTAKQAAAYMGISVHTLAKYRENKRGPGCRKLGSAVIYEREEVDAYMRNLPRRR